MWDGHWSRGAAERVQRLAPQVDRFIGNLRDAGALVVHCPSDTMPFYKDSPARIRMATTPRVTLPPEVPRPDPPLPVDASDGGSDTGETAMEAVWTRQHPAIRIDESQDGISDDGAEIYAFLQYTHRTVVLLVGVHTNFCILNRSFGIKQLVRWGLTVYLVRDLTDSMYNPARPPYVSHEAGTRLITDYVSKFWCPTILSKDVTIVPNPMEEGMS